MELCMPLKDGSLKTLVNEGVDWRYPGQQVPLDVNHIAEQSLHHMLRALECTARHRLIHRDVKPDNILFEMKQDKYGTPFYHFTLADFGLTNEEANAFSHAGTGAFMAPEIVQRNQRQTSKVDIWSLFATTVWVHSPADFREDLPSVDYSGNTIHAWLESVAKKNRYRRIRNMAKMTPSDRPSAERLLSEKAYKAVIEEEESTSTFEQDEQLTEEMGKMAIGQPPAQEFESEIGGQGFVGPSSYDNNAGYGLGGYTQQNPQEPHVWGAYDYGEVGEGSSPRVTTGGGGYIDAEGNEVWLPDTCSNFASQLTRAATVFGFRLHPWAYGLYL
jgi:serine/threonine protein kinase